MRAGFVAYNFCCHPSLRKLAGLPSLSVATIAHGSFSKDLTGRLEPAKEISRIQSRIRWLCVVSFLNILASSTFARLGMCDAVLGWFVAEAFAKQLYRSRIGGITLLGPLLCSCNSQCGTLCSTRYKFAELEELAACIHDQEGFFMLGRRIILIVRLCAS